MSRKHEEADFLEAIRFTLTHSGILVFRNNTGMATWGNGGRTRYGLGVGSADLIGCCRGKFCAIEVKSREGRQSPEQQCWERSITQAGGLYILARVGEMTVADVLRMVQEFKP